jgi:hypothetical protein
MTSPHQHGRHCGPGYHPDRVTVELIENADAQRNALFIKPKGRHAKPARPTQAELDLLHAELDKRFSR